MYWIGGYGSTSAYTYGNWPYVFPWFFFVWILFFGLVFLIWYLFFRFRRRWGCGYGWYRSGMYGHRDTPEEIARIRFAKGEITEEEFERLKEKLGLK